MRTLACLCLGLAIAGASCASRTPIGPELMDSYWSLRADPTIGAEPYRPALGERKLPARWILRMVPARAESRASLDRAAELLKQSPAEIDLAISPDQAREANVILARAQQVLRDLTELTQADPLSTQRWAAVLARALADVEDITRRGSATTTQPAARPLGQAAEPLLRMMAGYLDLRTGGQLLADLGPSERDRLRSVLAQIVLHLGLAIVARQVPADLRAAVTDAMGRHEKIEAVQADLTRLLTARIGEAPRSADGRGFRQVVQSVLATTDKALQIARGLVAQWDRMDRVELELYLKGRETLAAVTVTVLPGQEVRLPSVEAYQPVVAFRGTCRIAVLPGDGPTGETIVVFLPVGDGGVDLRFEGIVFGLARLLAAPMDSGRLREVRIFSKSREEGTQLLHLSALMEAAGDAKDNRRAIVFQDVTDKELIREPFSVRRIDRRGVQLFHYLTPTMRYTFRRATGPTDP